MNYVYFIVYPPSKDFLITVQILLTLPSRLLISDLYLGKFTYSQIFRLLLIVIFIGVIPDIVIFLYNQATPEQLRAFDELLLERRSNYLLKIILLIPLMAIFVIASTIFISSFWRIVSFVLTSEKTTLFTGMKNSIIMILFFIVITGFIQSNTTLDLSNFYVLGHFFFYKKRPHDQTEIIYCFTCLVGFITTLLNLFVLSVVKNAREKETI